VEIIIITIRRGINFFLELLFPSKCIGCHKYGSMLCSLCINKLHQAERETENGILASYDYRDPLIKDAIWKLKYHHSPHLGRRLGELLYDSFLEEIEEIKMFSSGSPIYVVPVPISKNRKDNRGYNQSEIIAKSFCNSAPLNIFQLKNKFIFKKTNTIPQAKLTNRSRRLQNIKGAFEIKNSEEVRGKTIIIIDDVTTTGGTILEIMKLLKKSGAKKVLGLAVAH
jgi:competence protein ComFC